MGDSHFGHQIRESSFIFNKAYTPLNHGSYGAFPQMVRTRQRELQDLIEGRSDPVIRFTVPKLLKESRETVAPLLGASSKEVVFMPNATTGINTVLRNLVYEHGDVILYMSTAYGACEKTILHCCEVTAAESVRINVEFPLEDAELISLFRRTAEQLMAQGKKVRIAMFDTVVTFPGVRLPWESLVKLCKDLRILSLIDGAHGIGHIDLTILGRVQPDFFTSNCYKWLYVPRGCAILYVPLRNHHLIRTTFPTSHGFQRLPEASIDALIPGSEISEDLLGDLFAWAATIDMTPYLCVPEALKFREQVCGGEAAIRQYCFDLAQRGGRLMADILQTESMDNETRTLSQCCFTMVRLPLTFGESKPLLYPGDGPTYVKWIMEQLMQDHDTWIPAKFYRGAIWVRVSAQIYLELKDFEWAARVLGDICDRISAG